MLTCTEGGTIPFASVTVSARLCVRVPFLAYSKHVRSLELTVWRVKFFVILVITITCKTKYIYIYIYIHTHTHTHTHTHITSETNRTMTDLDFKWHTMKKIINIGIFLNIYSKWDQKYTPKCISGVIFYHNDHNFDSKKIYKFIFLEMFCGTSYLMVFHWNNCFFFSILFFSY